MEVSFIRDRIHLLLITSLFSSSIAAQGTNYQQVFNLDAFSLQQTCVQYCFTTKLSGCTTDRVASAIGCPYTSCTSRFAAVDDCYCRSDLQSEAQSYLTSCIRKACTVGDTSMILSSAGSIYGAYCTSKGYTAEEAAAGTGTITAPPTGLSVTNKSGQTGTTVPSPTSSSTSTASSTSKTTYIISGIVAALAMTGIGTWVLLAAKRTKKSRKLQLQDFQPLDPYPRPHNGPPRWPQSTPTDRYSHDDISPEDSASHVDMSYPHACEASTLSSTIPSTHAMPSTRQY